MNSGWHANVLVPHHPSLGATVLQLCKSCPVHENLLHLRVHVDQARVPRSLTLLRSVAWLHLSLPGVQEAPKAVAKAAAAAAAAAAVRLSYAQLPRGLVKTRRGLSGQT